MEALAGTRPTQLRSPCHSMVQEHCCVIAVQALSIKRPIRRPFGLMATALRTSTVYAWSPVSREWPFACLHALGVWPFTQALDISRLFHCIDKGMYPRLRCCFAGTLMSSLILTFQAVLHFAHDHPHVSTNLQSEGMAPNLTRHIFDWSRVHFKYAYLTFRAISRGLLQCLRHFLELQH